MTPAYAALVNRTLAAQHRHAAFWCRAWGWDDVARDHELEAARHQGAAETLEREAGR